MGEKNPSLSHSPPLPLASSLAYRLRVKRESKRTVYLRTTYFPIRSLPTQGRSTSGTTMEPSACW